MTTACEASIRALLSVHPALSNTLKPMKEKADDLTVKNWKKYNNIRQMSMYKIMQEHNTSIILALILTYIVIKTSRKCTKCILIYKNVI